MTSPSHTVARRRARRTSALGLYASFDFTSALHYCLALLVSRKDEPTEHAPRRRRSSSTFAVDA
ncbi:MAG: hypothetical protein AAFQ18_04010 [Pseudomonadota bacterium]